MQLNSNRISYVVGEADLIEQLPATHALPIFSDHALDFLQAISKELLRSPKAKGYPDVVTFAFWCRKASLEALRLPYEKEIGRLGRGTVFHISPSNVAVNFAYSLVAGLLAGNANIVRLPSKQFEQVDLISNAFNAVLNNGFESMKPYVFLVKYGHDQEISDLFSSLCDTRVIWGGDQTIATIRKSPMRPRANEITFADRYSLCVIRAEEYLAAENKDAITLGFYNDTYLSDQNACTSPRILVWLGDKVKEAKEEFWSRLQAMADDKYTLQPVQAVNKLSTLCKLACAHPDVHLAKGKNTTLMRVQVDSLSGTLMDYRSNSGYFMEYNAAQLSEILPLCQTPCQTLSYYGLEKEELLSFLRDTCPAGIDRAVPIGKTMDFSLIWDGYDLIRTMSRVVSVS